MRSSVFPPSLGRQTDLRWEGEGLPTMRVSWVLAAVIAAVLLQLNLVLRRRAYPIPALDGAVLVTGCSSGIGRAACIALAQVGFHAVCAVRQTADADSLRQEHPNITSIILDVTSAEHIAAAVDALNALSRPLVGLVNNAGLGSMHPVETHPMEDLRYCFEVNFFGVVRLTQELLPMLRKNQGRVVIVGSLAGVIPAPPTSFAYFASKRAVESVADSLRAEMIPFNVSVSLLEPGAVQSDFIKSMKSAGRKSAPSPAADAVYGWLYRSEGLHGVHEKGMEMASPTTVTSDAILHALTSRHPQARYIVGNGMGVPAWVLAYLLPLVPDRMNDLVFSMLL